MRWWYCRKLAQGKAPVELDVFADISADGTQPYGASLGPERPIKWHHEDHRRMLPRKGSLALRPTQRPATLAKILTEWRAPPNFGSSRTRTMSRRSSATRPAPLLPSPFHRHSTAIGRKYRKTVANDPKRQRPLDFLLVALLRGTEAFSNKTCANTSCIRDAMGKWHNRATGTSTT